METTFNYQDVPANYLHCRNEQCSRAAECLRYQAGMQVTKETPFFVVVNTPHVENLKECLYFQPYQTTRMGVGIKNLYDKMPRGLGLRVKKRIHRYLGNGPYYRIRNGECVIKPKLETFIRKVFEEEGVGEEPVFDQYVERYDFTSYYKHS